MTHLGKGYPLPTHLSKGAPLLNLVVPSVIVIGTLGKRGVYEEDF